MALFLLDCPPPWIPENTGHVGTFFSLPHVATGGVLPYVWHFEAGILPPGLTLDTATGIISGVPTTVGVYGFQLFVTDAVGTVRGCSLGGEGGIPDVIIIQAACPKNAQGV